MSLFDPATDTVYVVATAPSNPNAGGIYVINAVTCNARKHSGCGKTPPFIDLGSGGGAALALDPTTDTLYATNGGANTLSLIDTKTCNAHNTSACGQTPPTTAVGGLPLSVAINQSTGTVYVGNATDNTVSVINRASCNAHRTSGCAHQATMHLGNFPWVGAIDETTDTVYVVNNGANRQGQNDTVSVVNGATCNAHNVSGCGQTPPQIPIGLGNINDSVGAALVPATHTLYVTNGGDNTLSMINTSSCHATHTSGCAKMPPAVSVGSNPQGVSFDPATHTVYVADSGDSVLSLLNGTTCNATDTGGCAHHYGAVRAGLSASSVALDTSTHTGYVVNTDGNDVSVVDTGTCNVVESSGCIHLPPTVAAGGFPDGVAVNNKTHTIYVANANDGTVSVINGARCNAAVTWGCDQTPVTVKVGSFPGFLTVNEATNTVYVPNNGGDNTISVINGATCNATNTTGCGQTAPTISDPGNPAEAAVDPLTNTVYVGNSDGTVSVINGNTCNGEVTTGCGQTPPTVNAQGSFIGDLTVNPLTNTVYAANFREGTIAVIDGRMCNATVTTGCTQIPPTVTLGSVPTTVGPSGVEVDQRTNTVYVTDCGRDPLNGSNNCHGTTVSVINGATCDSTVTSGCAHIPPTLTAGLGPYDVAIDQTTDTVYVVNISDFSVILVNGDTCNARHPSGCQRSFPTVQVGGNPDGIDVSSVTHTAYVANSFANNVSVFGPR